MTQDVREVNGKAFEVLPQMPDDFYKSRGRWRQVFDPLKYGQTVKLECDNMEEAEKLRRSASQAIRQVKEVDYSLETRRQVDGKKVILYMRKIQKNKS